MSSPGSCAASEAVDAEAGTLVSSEDVPRTCCSATLGSSIPTVGGGFIIAPKARGSLARRMLDLSGGHLRGAVPDRDQASAEQLLERTSGLRLTMQADDASRRHPQPAIGPLPEAAAPDEVRDVFISHAGPDKAGVARPLAAALLARGYSVWFDEFELVVGDRLSSAIDRGLATSRCGVVVLSPAFMQRPWPLRELSGLVARETVTGDPLVLPVWHEVDRDAVVRFSPPLADVVAIETSQGVDAVADALALAIERRRGQEVLAGRALPAAEVIERPTRAHAGSMDGQLSFDLVASKLARFNVAPAHRFQIEHGDVYRVLALAILASFVAVRAHAPESVSEWLAPVAPAVALAALALWVFDNYAWRWPGVSKLVGRPILHGTWHGELASNWSDPSTRERIASDPDVFLVVRQRFWQVTVRLLTKESSSASTLAEFMRHADGVYQLVYMYSNTPRPEFRHRSALHQGVVVLHAPLDREDVLEGAYFTDRSTTGALRFRRHFATLIGTYDAGSRLIGSGRSA